MFLYKSANSPKKFKIRQKILFDHLTEKYANFQFLVNLQFTL